MRNMSFKLRPILFVLVAIFSTNFMSSCIKDKFDTPPINGEDPALTVTTTIAELKQLFEGEPVEITDDLIIAGVVSADDESGNFYKDLIIEDASGGILIRIDRADAYVNFPVGRRIFIKCKGLWLGDYNNLIQLGGTLAPDPVNPGVNGIADALIDQFLFPGQYNLTVIPTLTTIADLNRVDNNRFQSMLIKLENVEFDNASKGQMFADASNPQNGAKNLTVTDCDGNKIIVRTSGYSSFASLLASEKIGTLVAVFSIFNETPQLKIRDENDVMMENDRCSGSGGLATPISIGDMRALYTSPEVSTPSNKKIKGIIISDRTTESINKNSFVIQDGTAAILVYNGSGFTHSFNLGDEVEINITGGKLSRYKDGLQLSNVVEANMVKTGTGIIAPRIATVADINSNISNWESQLVIINGANITGNSGKFGMNSVLIKDASAGELLLFTRNESTFSGNAYPTGTRNITGILSIFDGTKQLIIRSPSDIQ
jgi:DNA/RNA endonuclease YhcR with UshA esterase domain